MAVNVALHPEGVDRNGCVFGFVGFTAVALHPEGVDRNFLSLHFIIP